MKEEIAGNEAKSNTTNHCTLPMKNHGIIMASKVNMKIYKSFLFSGLIFLTVIKNEAHNRTEESIIDKSAVSNPVRAAIKPTAPQKRPKIALRV